MSGRHPALVAACLLALTPRLRAAPPPPAQNPATEPDLSAEAAFERGRLCFEAVDLTCADHELTLAVEGQLPPAARLEALRLLAELHFGRDDRARARELCITLIALDPAFAPAAWPEPWQRVLSEARRLAPDNAPPLVIPAWPAAVRRGMPLEVAAHVTDPSGVARCELVISPDGQRLRMRTDDGQRWTTDVPVEFTARDLWLSIEAWDKVGNGPTRAPADAPHHVPVAPGAPAEHATPLTSQWWFWAGLAVVAVGVGVGLGFALAPAGAGGGRADGDLRVVPRFPGSL